MVATGFTGPRERVRTFGVYAAISVGGPLGLLTGVSLPACPIPGFNLIFALVALVASAYCRTTPRWTAPTPTPTPVPPSTGLPGALLGSLGPAALTFGLTRAQRWTDGGDQRVVGALAIGLSCSRPSCGGRARHRARYCRRTSLWTAASSVTS
ncbi:PGF-CTERM sorting domain-containing protein [Streptomyces sp. NPDC055092]